MEKLKEKYKLELSKFLLQKKNIPRLWNISEQTAELLYMLIRAKAPENILEIGTSNGYSTFWFSLAAEQSGATIDTIEVDEDRFNLAKKNLVGRKNVILRFGKAEYIIPELDKKYDFVFIDAGKVGYVEYIKLLIEKLNDDAIIIADNVISHKDTIQEYLDFIKSSTAFESMTLSIDNGLEISLNDGL